MTKILYTQMYTQHGVYKLVSGIVWFLTNNAEYKLHIPESASMQTQNVEMSLRQIILQETHDAPYPAHVGIAKRTLDELQSQFH